MMGITGPIRLWIVLAIYLMLALVQNKTLQAQSFIQPPPQFPEALPSPEPVPVPHQQPLFHCPTQYWVVSSYPLPQKPGARPQDLKFDYYHKPGAQDRQKIDLFEFRGSLNPYIPTVVFVHGSFVDFDTAVSNAGDTYRWLKKTCPSQPFNFIAYVWPSSGRMTGIAAIDVSRSGARASQNGTYLSRVIDLIPTSSRLTMIGHSHGARVLASALHYRAGGEIYGRYSQFQDYNPRRVRIVFAAAAINHQWLNPNRRYGLAVSQMESLLNVRNRNDLALAAYPLVSPMYGPALARSGFTTLDQYLLGRQVCKLYEVDASDLVGVNHRWPIYTKHEQVAHMIAPYVFFLPNHHVALKPVAQ